MSKKNLISSVISVLSLFMLSCTSTQKTQVNPMSNADTQLLTGWTWKLTELDRNSVPDKINGKEPFLTFSDTTNRFSASAGCNLMNGHFSLPGKNKIKFSQSLSTLMACPDMEIESRLAEVIREANQFYIQGNLLTLSKGGTKVLAHFERIEENTTRHALNGSWQVDYISGIRIAFDGLYPDKKPEIHFNLPETKATGHSSCNSFSTNFHLDGSNIRFEYPASTRMFCPGEGESTFFSILKKINKFSISDNVLNLNMDDITLIRLKKVE